MIKLETNEQFDKLMQNTTDFILFKRSTRCPTSFAAFEAFRRFTESHPEITSAYVNVIEERPVSQHIAEVTGVTHQSPQVLLFHKGKVVWQESHNKITEEALTLHYK